MNPDEKKYERRFRCPTCQEPIFSRIGSCTHCGTRFGVDTLFSCPKCGALVKQLELVCPACGVKMMDWGITSEEMGFISPKIEPEPMTAKPISGLKIERPPRTRLVVSRKLISADREMPKQKFFDLREKSVPPPRSPQKIQGKAAPTKISRTDAMRGRTNGTRTGRVNGTQQGRINGTRLGRINGTQQGRINGTKQGRVNGTKEQFPRILAKPSSRLQTPIAGRLILWQLLIVLGICAILILSAVMIFLIPYNQGQHRIAIDGDFSDWASVPSYHFSALLPGIIPEIAEAKLSHSEDSLYMYFHFEDLAFSGSNTSTVYAFIDTDGDPNTGYRLSSHFGADSIMALTGWDGIAREGGYSNFGQSSDNSNWSMWQIWNKPTMAVSQREVEMSVYEPSGNPKVELVSVSDGNEERGPMMSTAGTIVAVQNPKFSGGVLTNPLQSVMTVSLIAMGAPGGEISVQSGLVNGSGVQFGGGTIVVSSTDWTTANFSADLSGYMAGDSFSFAFAGTATSFTGPLDVMGEPSRGYYLSAPSKITVDGLFGDWTGRKISDNDTTPIDNPNIDIKEYGAATQSNSHFFYVGVNGKALGGADVPEERVKPSSGGGGPPVVRLRKTGEDLLQAFIDNDPGNGTGHITIGGNRTIQADYLIEVFGRRGLVTTSSVEQWSSSAYRWIPLGGIDKIGIEGQGIEFSVAKTLLGNLTGSEVIFFTTDWKARSDNCWFTGALKDPWVITSSGSSYQSLDGITWASSGSITLQGSGSNADTKIVDMITNVDKTRVWAVSDHGRIYTNVSGDTWTSNLTIDLRSAPSGRDTGQGSPISDVIAIAAYPSGASEKIFLLTQRGYTYITKSTINEGSSGVCWDNNSQRVASFTDFDDVWYADPTSTTSNYYVMRSTTNTPLYWAPIKSAFTATTATGATSMTQTDMVIYPGASRATDIIYVLYDHGTIRRSTDGGTSWADFGDLPHPIGGNQTTIYVGITLDPSNIIWVVTDNGWVYKSTAALGGTFVKTQKLSYTGIIAIVGLHSIPEFSDVLVPVFLAMVIPAVIITRNRRSRRGKSDAD